MTLYSQPQALDPPQYLARMGAAAVPMPIPPPLPPGWRPSQESCRTPRSGPFVGEAAFIRARLGVSPLRWRPRL